MNDLGIGNHTGEAVSIRPLFPHPSPAYMLGACHILRHAIAHEYRLVRGNLQSLQRRLEDLRMGFADADIRREQQMVEEVEDAEPCQVFSMQ